MCVTCFSCLITTFSGVITDLVGTSSIFLFFEEQNSLLMKQNVIFWGHGEGLS